MSGVSEGYTARMTEDRCAQNLKHVIKELLQDLREHVFLRREEQSVIGTVELFFQNMHPPSIMAHVIKHVLPHRDMIRERNETFFYEHQEAIFGGLPKGNVHYFGRQFREGRVSDANKMVVWQYFDAIVKFCDDYQKLR